MSFVLEIFIDNEEIFMYVMFNFNVLQFYKNYSQFF